MGLSIDRESFSEDDHRAFAARLRADLLALERLLERPGFGTGPLSIGAEVELSLIDAAGRPLADPAGAGGGRTGPAGPNERVIAATGDPRLTVELNRYNLEYNSRPVPLAGRPFRTLDAEMAEALASIARAAAPLGGRPILIGVLPTLRAADLAREAMTNVPRFRALSTAIRRLRGGAVLAVHIDGEDPLDTACDDVTWEGANTSLQLHLRVPPAAFAATHTAVQIATAPALAAAGNAPLFLGHRLWEETRIALFKQAVDERGRLPASWHPAARVSFGHGWLRASALEAFAESVSLHAPLLPALDDEDPLVRVAAGGVPRLGALRLHHGTVWRWNRAVYDPAEGGHLRIELRALPSGPTRIDMLANAAFLIGATLGLRDEVGWMVSAFPFEHAHRNFYRAAQHGLDAELLWPHPEAPSPRPRGAAALVAELLPVARAGLLGAGVEAEEADALLDVVRDRVASGRTGARWQRRALAALERERPRERALAALVELYLEESAANRPVHRWESWERWERGERGEQ
jgi:hypothetical protein